MHALRPRSSGPTHAGRFPAGRLTIGILLIAAAWPLSWNGPVGLGSHTFFPLWLGYILSVDSLTDVRAGSSLWSRSPRAFITLFGISAPLWWLYEGANVRLQNWHYHLPHEYGWLHYRAESSLAFSTVLPATLATSELLMTTRLRLIGESRWGRPLSRPLLRWTMLLGALMLGAAMIWPRFFFPLVWIGGFLMLDPVNALAGRRSLLVAASRGHWSPIIVLAVSSLMCGFFWEMWNIRAMPKWTYEIPYFDWVHLFEMPIPGYGGYIPFAFGLYAAYHLISTVLPGRSVVRLTIDQRGSDSRGTGQS